MDPFSDPPTSIPSYFWATRTTYRQSLKYHWPYAAYEPALISPLTLGTGTTVSASIYDAILANTSDELLFVTCFWAPSSSQKQFSTLLRALSDKALAFNICHRIRVRLCLSSLNGHGLERLLDGRLRGGKAYQLRSLGLPEATELQGLDISVLGQFERPFGVLHPKFAVADRKTVLLPSCNVSWEEWLEGAVELRGDVVAAFVRYWRMVWGKQGSGIPHELESSGIDIAAAVLTEVSATSSTDNYIPVTTLLLPSKGFRNPGFRPFPCQNAPTTPPTPLNDFTLQLFASAQRSIFVQTPNVTSPPVLDALQQALERGVDVRIVTNERLMTMEQLVTAGTTTPRCLARLIRKYAARRKKTQAVDVQYRGQPALGKLRIEYFTGIAKTDTGKIQASNTHLKLTIVDGEVVILGSGNMDRASWFTSQELGVGFASAEYATTTLRTVEDAIAGCVRTVYDSTAA